MVACRCGALGPLGRDIEEAWRLWDTRPDADLARSLLRPIVEAWREYRSRVHLVNMRITEPMLSRSLDSASARWRDD